MALGNMCPWAGQGGYYTRWGWIVLAPGGKVKKDFSLLFALARLALAKSTAQPAGVRAGERINP